MMVRVLYNAGPHDRPIITTVQGVVAEETKTHLTIDHKGFKHRIHKSRIRKITETKYDGNDR